MPAPSVLGAACEGIFQENCIFCCINLFVFLDMPASLKRNKTLLYSILRCAHHTPVFLVDLAVLNHMKHSWYNLHGEFSLGSFINCHD